MAPDHRLATDLDVLHLCRGADGIQHGPGSIVADQIGMAALCPQSDIVRGNISPAFREQFWQSRHIRKGREHPGRAAWNNPGRAMGPGHRL
ncbi:hypothetical protein D3C72_2118880 [compost metagenome]